MDLLDRYLQAVKFWLPGKQSQDILAELSEDIRSEIEDKEGELGRPIGSTELEAILTRWGHPMRVAERYLPQQSLIGPVLLPAYTLVLKIATFFCVVPRTLVWIGFVIFNPSYRTADAIANGLMSTWLTVLHLLVGITAIFAVMEWRQGHSRAWETWTASQLLEHERARDPNEIPRSQSIAELVGGLIAAWWWLTLVGSPSSYRFEDTFQITLWPLYSWAYWPILVFLLAGVVLASVNLFRPSWTRERAGARLAIDALGLVLAVVLAIGPFIEVVAANPKPGAADLARWANLFWDITAWSIGISCAARIVQDVRRMVGKKPIQNPAMTALGAN